MGKKLKEVCLGKRKFRYNNVYKTYNGVDNNDLLSKWNLGKRKLNKC